MSDIKGMTQDELEAELRARGAEPGQWGKFGGGTPGSQPRFVIKQIENLRALQGVLEGAVKTKRTEVELLQEKLVRLQYGGGS